MLLVVFVIVIVTSADELIYLPRRCEEVRSLHDGDEAGQVRFCCVLFNARPAAHIAVMSANSC